jgi:hypothetical protein
MTLLATLTPTASVSTVAATSLTASKQFIIFSNGSIVQNAISGLQFQTSSDNGSNYSAGRTFSPTNSVSPYGFANIYLANFSANKNLFYTGAAGAFTSTNETVVTGVINAIQITSSVSTFTGVGSFYIYGIN